MTPDDLRTSLGFKTSNRQEIPKNRSFSFLKFIIFVEVERKFELDFSRNHATYGT